MKSSNPFRVFQIIAALIFFGLAALEAINDLNGVARAGFFAHSNIVGIVVVPILVLAGAALLIPQPRVWRPYLAAAGIFTALMHGSVLRVGRTTTSGVSGGALFIVGAVAVVALLSPIVREWLADRGLVSSRLDRAA
jgi:hypothetical protein